MSSHTILLLLIAAVYLPSIPKALLECQQPHSCAYGDILTDDDLIDCSGFKSCAYSTTLIAENAECSGSYGCYSASSINLTEGLDCYGLMSCSNISSIVSHERITCSAESACTQSHMTTPALNCNGDRSCANSIVNLTTYEFDDSSNVWASGHLSTMNAIFYPNAGITYFRFAGAFSALNTTINCLSGRSCILYCYGSACSYNLTVNCDNSYMDNINNNINDTNTDNDNNNNMTCNIDILYFDTSEMFDINNLDTITTLDNSLLQPLVQIHSNSNEFEFLYPITDTTNSIELCNDVTELYASYSSKIEIANCAGYQICAYGSNSSISTNVIGTIAAVCCQGRSSCDGRGSLTTSIFYDYDDLDTTLQNAVDLYSSTSIRCDGSNSCFELQHDIVAGGNGGNIYFTGYQAYTTDDNFGLVENQNIFNTICSGANSALRAQIMNNKNVYITGVSGNSVGSINNIVNNIYAYGAYSIRSGNISEIKQGNVYCGGAWSCQDTRINNVYNGNVYCAAYLSCKGSVISNINGNGNDQNGTVYARGLLSLQNAKISSVRKIVIYGNKALEGAMIENVGNIIIYGNNVTDGALIKSGNNYNEIDLMIIGEHNSNLRFVCQEGHNCKITCSSQCSIQLKCHGNCTTSGEIEILDFETTTTTTTTTLEPDVGSTIEYHCIRGCDSNDGGNKSNDNELETFWVIWAIIGCFAVIAGVAIVGRRFWKKRNEQSHLPVVDFEDGDSSEH